MFDQLATHISQNHKYRRKLDQQYLHSGQEHSGIHLHK